VALLVKYLCAEEMSEFYYCLREVMSHYSHTTNDCNVFHRQIQVDQSLFPTNTIDLQCAKVLV
jgi:hypothetical protein